jgi:hypothetical protein
MAEQLVKQLLYRTYVKKGRAALAETKLQNNVWCTLPRYRNGRENIKMAEQL